MTQNPSSVVIVGGGLAGAKTAEALRAGGYDGAVTLLGAERHLPYERPPLSKGYLAGKAEFDEAIVHPADWYQQNDVDLRTGVDVTAVHPDSSAVELSDGDRVGYGALVLATGAEPVRLPLPGSEHALTLRNREDSDAIRETFGAGKRLVVVGGGWIGLEVASAAREQGTEVTILEAAELPLLRVLGPEMARVFADLHRERGVELRTEISIDAISPDAVQLGDGARIEADAIVMGVGVRPRVDLAARAGLQVDNGVLVDAALRTSDPAIFAIGDIANHDHPVLGERVRVEHWANALNQPAAVAAAIGGDESGYRELPYFFSDQYDLGMEYIGHVPPGTAARVFVRGNTAGREFVAFWVAEDDRLLAAMNVNVWDVVDELKPLVAARERVDPAKLADASTPYAEVGAKS
jgi:NADPH-dependent 2,4-dienoyl-CoA reductase/sulfur reductase-like enzyme